jgi:hypothetical protein
MRRLLFLILLLTLSASAQTAFTGISVSVTDKDGAVIPGALVTAVNADTGQKWKSQTNLAGECRLPNVALGKYVVNVSKRGFRTETMQVNVNNLDQGFVHVEIKLRCKKCRFASYMRLRLLSGVIKIKISKEKIRYCPNRISYSAA